MTCYLFIKLIFYKWKLKFSYINDMDDFIEHSFQNLRLEVSEYDCFNVLFEYKEKVYDLFSILFEHNMDLFEKYKERIKLTPSYIGPQLKNMNSLIVAFSDVDDNNISILDIDIYDIYFYNQEVFNEIINYLHSY